jgi:hypothetical protein
MDLSERKYLDLQIPLLKGERRQCPKKHFDTRSYRNSANTAPTTSEVYFIVRDKNRDFEKLTAAKKNDKGKEPVDKTGMENLPCNA